MNSFIAQWLELIIDLPTMNGFIAQWLELIIDISTMNSFIAQWLELIIDLPTMNSFIAQWLELTIDLPTMNGFIAQWLEHLPRHHRSTRFESRSGPNYFSGKYVQLLNLQYNFQDRFSNPKCLCLWVNHIA